MIIPSRFVEFWWSFSSTVNLDDYFYSSINPVIEKKDYYLSEIKPEYRPVIKPLMFVEYVTNKGFHLRLHLPNMEAIQLADNKDEFIHKAFKDDRYLSILNAAFGDYSLSTYVDILTVKVYCEEFNRLADRITFQSDSIQRFLKSYTFDINKTESVIVHTTSDYIGKTVFLASGEHKKGMISVVTPIRNILWCEGSQLLVKRTDDVSSIRAPSFLVTDDPALMDTLYQPWCQNTLSYLHENHEMISEHCNVFLKVKNSSLSDHEKLLIFLMTKDHRIIELITDPELKQKALEV